MSTSIHFSSFCLLFFSVLRHLQPAVQLLFVSQLARQLAKQLDCERGCCQPPVFEASVPLSDFQREKLPVPEKLKSLCFSFSLLRMQGVQCLEQSLKKHGAQEFLILNDFQMVCYILLYPCQYNDFICGPLRPNVGEIENSTVEGRKKDMAFRNCSTF